ncbi:hypothetical protein KO493_02795 [Tamlana agarivorans]|uniref:Uncharacterized protein n=1 Tax=Pseudotamlana agarivorans TaxID=481183 RepID=A0ACC5U5M7_9FLAO|nr:hypothetical protein [Tamlana agarivorans]MBU2949622.1 hypothetical protein [Tamlana agarivorans]
MPKKVFFVNSLKYIIVSGASKGFNYVVLLYLAIGAFSEQYVAILLLLSLEQLLSLLLPLNNSHIIYSKTITTYEFITNKLISSSLIVLIIYVLLFFLTKQIAYAYFEVKTLIVYLCLFTSMIINAYMAYLTNYYKLIEEHDKALLIQALLFISFVSIIISIIFIDNKIIAFFVGKAGGLLIALLLVKILKLNKFKFKFVVLTLDEFKKMINLFSISVLGWVSGLGFMNLAKIYSTSEELVKVGYIINLCNVFLLISIGINSIYNPLIKKYFLAGDYKNTIGTRIKTLFIYLSIAGMAFLVFLLLNNVFPFDWNLKAKDILLVFPFTIVIFIFNSFQSVAQPFYMINEKFKTYNIINLAAYFAWGLIMVVCLYLGYNNFVLFLLLLHFFKGLFSYSYVIKFLNSNDYSKINRE